MEDALEAAALRRDLVAAPAPRLSSGVSTFKDSFGLQRALLTPLVALMCIPNEAALRGAPRDALGRRQGGPFDYRALAGHFEDVSEVKFWCATAGRKRSDNQDRHWLLCRLPDTLLCPGAATELASDPGCPDSRECPDLPLRVWSERGVRSLARSGLEQARAALELRWRVV